MQINVKETVVDKLCIEFIANHIAQYGDDPSTWSTWQAALKAAELAQLSHNIDYTAALETELKRNRLSDHIDLEDADIHELATRLNAALQKQHCV
jgi:hypothetical protein